MTIYLLFLLPLFAFAHVASMGLDPKIVGGRLATPGEIPYQVSLQRIETENHFCGGVIISQWYILTAAHCVDGVNVSTISAHVGLINLREPHAVHLIESSYIHENYNRNDTTNDIALLKLQSPLKYSSLVSPVVLTANETVPAGTGAAVSGFGRLFYRGTGPKSTRLYVANIEIASQAFCLKMYTRFAFRNINDKQICANDPMVERGSCTGDAGGPLTVNGELIGIVSWQFECASKIYPTIYVRVPSYFSWIVEHT